MPPRQPLGSGSASDRKRGRFRSGRRPDPRQRRLGPSLVWGPGGGAGGSGPAQELESAGRALPAWESGAPRRSTCLSHRRARGSLGRGRRGSPRACLDQGPGARARTEDWHVEERWARGRRTRGERGDKGHAGARGQRTGAWKNDGRVDEHGRRARGRGRATRGGRVARGRARGRKMGGGCVDEGHARPAPVTPAGLPAAAPCAPGRALPRLSGARSARRGPGSSWWGARPHPHPHPHPPRRPGSCLVTGFWTFPRRVALAFPRVRARFARSLLIPGPSERGLAQAALGRSRGACSEAALRESAWRDGRTIWALPGGRAGGLGPVWGGLPALRPSTVRARMSTAQAARFLDASEPRGRLGAEGGRPRTLSRNGCSRAIPLQERFLWARPACCPWLPCSCMRRRGKPGETEGSRRDPGRPCRYLPRGGGRGGRGAAAGGA